MINAIADEYDYFLNEAVKMVGQDGKDLLHECILYVGENPKNIANARDYRAYFKVIMNRAAFGNTSIWAKTRKLWMSAKELTDVVESDFVDDTLLVVMRSKIDILLDRIDLFDKWVYLAYVDTDVTFKVLSVKCDVPKRTLYDSYNKTVNYLKTNLK